jgi:cytochrome P450 family 142 subfamily A polypeptide 1
VASDTERLTEHTRARVAAGPVVHPHRGEHPVRDDVDLLDGRFYATEPHEAWGWMRENAPAYHDPHSDVWALTRYDDVMAASRDPHTFSNAQNIRPQATPVPMMISMDDPEHKRRRKLVSKGFTPRRVAEQAPRIAEICDVLIDAVADRGECDFVADLAAPLPLIVIGDMLGVAPEDRDDLLRWSDTMLRATTSTDLAALEEGGRALEEYQAYIDGVIADRRAHPRDDLISVLVHAEVDGDRLDDESLLWETLLVLVGGDETTRHVLSGGLHALLLSGEGERLRAEPQLLDSAVEEMLRWVSPIKTMNRRVTRDVAVAGQHLAAGDDVLLVYPSANRDHRQFPDPDRFDIGRDPNHHLAFGFGAHFCLGNALARVELRAMFDRLAARFPHLEPAWGSTDPPRRPSSFISGFDTLPVRFSPA